MGQSRVCLRCDYSFEPAALQLLRTWNRLVSRWAQYNSRGQLSQDAKGGRLPWGACCHSHRSNAQRRARFLAISSHRYRDQVCNQQSAPLGPEISRAKALVRFPGYRAAREAAAERKLDFNGDSYSCSSSRCSPFKLAKQNCCVRNRVFSRCGSPLNRGHRVEWEREHV